MREHKTLNTKNTLLNVENVVIPYYKNIKNAFLESCVSYKMKNWILLKTQNQITTLM